MFTSLRLCHLQIHLSFGNSNLRSGLEWSILVLLILGLVTLRYRKLLRYIAILSSVIQLGPLFNVFNNSPRIFYGFDKMKGFPTSVCLLNVSSKAEHQKIFLIAKIPSITCQKLGKQIHSHFYRKQK